MCEIEKDTVVNDGSTVDLRYLKDWKFNTSTDAAGDGEVSPLFVTPSYFQEDWLNAALSSSSTSSSKGAYNFCYLGPAGTSTRLHSDVLQSYSWSTNVLGTKRWILIPERYTFLLYDVFGVRVAGHVWHDLESGFGQGGGWLYPGLSEARKRSYKLIQSSGSTIFVPSGWFHTVENVTHCLSVNCNWLNGYNLGRCWGKLRGELSGVEEGMGGQQQQRQEQRVGGEEEGASEDGYNPPIVFNSGDGAEDKGKEDAKTQQVGGDLHLLYNVIVHRVKFIMEVGIPKAGPYNDMFGVFKRDLKTIEGVLREIVEIFVEGDRGDVHEVRMNCDYRGKEVLGMVVSVLEGLG